MLPSLRKFILVIVLAAIVSCQSTPTSLSKRTVPSSQTKTPDNWAVSKANSSPTIAGCQVFPADNPWNQDISQEPVDVNADKYIASINRGGKFLNPNFGSKAKYGIPYTIVDSTQPKVPVQFEYVDESDPDPYPIPPNPPIQASEDRHLIILEKDNCMLYELYNAQYSEDVGWSAGTGAIFDLKSNALRPDCWTSADAAGLAILPGLVRYDEVASGKIQHALRLSVSQTQQAFIHPATHYASRFTNPNLPPMGLRLRLKASFDTSRYTGQARVILNALKKYGLIVADNGTSWNITGAPDRRWNDDDLNQLKQVPGSAFEVIASGAIRKEC
ncbi:hypothetical protein NIES4073_44360 [Kalymmatonema gypsitolerans NIES-4073]|nr:hypothetical protein NIES4073_44360 [Scytonema sp. NIES-4073]